MKRRNAGLGGREGVKQIHEDLISCPPSISVVTLSMQVSVTPSYSVQGKCLALSDGATVSVRDLKGGQEALMPMVALPDPTSLSGCPPSAVSSPKSFSPPLQV
jgi:hypothetical protein